MIGLRIKQKAVHKAKTILIRSEYFTIIANVYNGGGVRCGSGIADLGICPSIARKNKPYLIVVAIKVVTLY
jgi:hypothetical protein